MFISLPNATPKNTINRIKFTLNDVSCIFFLLPSVSIKHSSAAAGLLRVLTEVSVQKLQSVHAICQLQPWESTPKSRYVQVPIPWRQIKRGSTCLVFFISFVSFCIELVLFLKQKKPLKMIWWPHLKADKQQYKCLELSFNVILCLWLLQTRKQIKLWKADCFN